MRNVKKPKAARSAACKVKNKKLNARNNRLIKALRKDTPALFLKAKQVFSQKGGLGL